MPSGLVFFRVFLFSRYLLIRTGNAQRRFEPVTFLRQAGRHAKKYSNNLVQVHPQLMVATLLLL